MQLFLVWCMLLLTAWYSILKRHSNQEKLSSPTTVGPEDLKDMLPDWLQGPQQSCPPLSSFMHPVPLHPGQDLLSPSSLFKSQSEVKVHFIQESFKDFCKLHPYLCCWPLSVFNICTIVQIRSCPLIVFLAFFRTFSLKTTWRQQL